MIGAPLDFDFLAEVRSATVLKIAIAFGHVSGWNQVQSAVANSPNKNVRILLGQSYLHTEPDLLDMLLKLQSPKFQTKLAPVEPTFHPKVWIFHSHHQRYAVVGSANLSLGGLAENTECSAYLSNEEALDALDHWFVSHWKAADPLTSDLCRAYRRRYSETITTRTAAAGAIRKATRELSALETTWRRQAAIEQARKYFTSSEGKEEMKARTAAMASIERCLRPPSFRFDKRDWHQFLRIPEFGSMRRIRKATDAYLPQLRKAFLYLADEKIPLAERIDNVVPNGSRYHVPGVGINIVTKVLAMLSPEKRPVYNDRVANTLAAFGYDTNHATTDGTMYAKFCDEMNSFAAECGLSEMLSIDSFFEYYSRKDQ